MHLRYRFSLISIFFFLSIFSGELLAQTEIPLLSNGEPDSSLIKKYKPISLNQIPTEIEKVESDIKLGEKKIVPKKEILEIDSLFPLYINFLTEEKKKADYFIEANPNKQKIENLINKWNGYYGQLDIWQNTINSIEDKNMDLVNPFKEKEYLWSITLDLAKNEEAPASLLNNIQRTLREITTIKQAIIDENNSLITLETKIINQKSVVNATIDEFHSLKNSEIYTVFYHRHKALWNTSFKNVAASNKEKLGKESLPNKFLDIGEYFEENKKQVYSFLTIIFLISILLVYFKRAFQQVKFTEQDANLQRAKEIVVSHTFPAIVFIFGIIALLYLDNIPFLLSDILMLIALFASVPMLKNSIYSRFENILYFIIAFYVINSAKTYIWFSSPYYRVYLILEAILMMLVILYFTRPYLKTRNMQVSRFGKIIIRSVPVFYFIILSSIIANLLGYTNLTDLELKVITISSSLTVTFYGMLLVASGLIVGVIHMIFIKQDSYNEERKFKVEKRSLNAIRAVVFLWWIYYFLGILDIRDTISSWYSDILINSYSFGSVSFTLEEILTFAVVLIVSFIISNFISMIVDGGALSFLKLPKGIPAAIAMVLRYFVISFGFILALSALGVDLSSFNLMAGALGLGIGFGLQTIISNFVSGIILVFERPILPGDTVEVQNLLGTVTNIGVRASRMRTFDGAEVVVPNNNLISNDLINWTLSDNVKRIEILIGAAYGSDPNIVLEVLVQAAESNEFTLVDPKPVAFFNEFGDSSLNFRLLAWVPYNKGLISKSNISVAIYNAFKENGIEIPFPQSDIHVKDINSSLPASKFIQKKTQAKKTTQKESRPIKDKIQEDPTKGSSTSHEDKSE